MAILFGAELGPKADPTTTTYTPRPEWYFFFLFELLRVVKPPALVFLATIGIPTICLVLLLLLPFYDRSPERNPLRRPIAMTAGIATIAAMAYLTILGAIAGSPTEIEPSRDARIRGGQGDHGLVRLPGLPQDRRERQHARPEPHRDRRAPRQDAIARTLVNPTSPMPSYAQLQRTNPSSSTSSSQYVASLRATSEGARERGQARVRHAARHAGPGDVRPDRPRLRPHERS